MRSGAEVQALTQLALARLELTPPPNFFTVAIQQPGNSYPSSRLSLLLVGVFWMYKASFTLVACIRSLLTRVKDPLPKEKLAGVVYQIPCQCGKVYVGETQRRLETRVKEHRDACNKGDTGKSAIAEHQWDQQHQVNWEDTRVLDRASRPVQLRVKEALYIQKTPPTTDSTATRGTSCQAAGSQP